MEVRRRFNWSLVQGLRQPFLVGWESNSATLKLA
jgi:hypothetical protein